MGLNTSKHTSPSSSSLSSSVRRSRSRRREVLKSSCLRSDHSINDNTQVSGCSSEENVNTVSCSSINKSCSSHVSAKCSRKDKAIQSDEMNCTTSDSELDEWGESSFNDTVSRETSSSSRTFSSRSLNLTSRFLSRFNLYPGNLSFRINSSRAHADEHAIPSTTTMKRNDRLNSRDFFPACFTRSLRMQDEDSVNNLQSGPSADFSDNLQNNIENNSGDDVERIRNDTVVNSSPDLFSPCYGSEIRCVNRRNSAREPAESNVQFSRTLSVGRLRDRVLQRTRVPDLDLRHFQEDGEVRHTSHVNGRRDLSHSTVESTSEEDNFLVPVSSNNVISISSFPFYGNQNHGRETPRARETRYRDLLEHRSNFLERRRRIRSQVRALQRLGSRFENLSGHERSCILSGQNRAGHCTCRPTGRDANSNDETTARASISRIVILAEALFEVLDEIHQQSVVLTSRPSVSSIGSIPAPSEVVDSLPSKIFGKLRKKPTEEAAQCYICLVEYEEGDSIRILPCHHEFHLACVDKWLKEVHRICPLCRGDICRPESST